MAEKTTQLAPQPTENPVTLADSPTRAPEYVAQMRAARSAGLRWRRISRWIGLACFIVGAVLLIYVFWQALAGLREFSNAGRLNSDFNRALSAYSSVEDAASPPIQRVIQATSAVIGTEILRVFYLLILGFIASALAARGIQFFAASESVIDEAVVPEE